MLTRCMFAIWAALLGAQIVAVSFGVRRSSDGFGRGIEKAARADRVQQLIRDSLRNREDLRIYDAPRELSEFTGLRDTRFGAAPYDIKRAPQSWCYVEATEEGEKA